MRYSIYTLTNPITNEIFYVGKTIDLRVRFKAHLSLRTADSDFKNQIVEFILSSGKMPIIEELDYIEFTDKIDNQEVNRLEIYWINQMKQWGFNLCNIHGLSGRKLYQRENNSYELGGYLFDDILEIINKKSSWYRDLKYKTEYDNNITSKEKVLLIDSYKESWKEWVEDLFVELSAHPFKR